MACLTSVLLSAGSGSAACLIWLAVGEAKGGVCHFPGNFWRGRLRQGQFPGKFGAGCARLVQSGRLFLQLAASEIGPIFVGRLGETADSQQHLL